MYNAFVGATCAHLASIGVSTLRFDFSAEGGGEDAEALLATNRVELGRAVRLLRETQEAKQPGVPLLLVGYSWGSLVALSACRDDGVGRLVHALALVCPPLDAVPPQMAPRRDDFAARPTMLLCGDDDDYCSRPKLDSARADLDAARPGAGADAFTLVPGAAHFLGGDTALPAVATFLRGSGPGARFRPNITGQQLP